MTGPPIWREKWKYFLTLWVAVKSDIPFSSRLRQQAIIELLETFQCNFPLISLCWWSPHYFPVDIWKIVTSYAARLENSSLTPMVLANVIHSCHLSIERVHNIGDNSSVACMHAGNKPNSNEGARRQHHFFHLSFRIFYRHFYLKGNDFISQCHSFGNEEMMTFDFSCLLQISSVVKKL